MADVTGRLRTVCSDIDFGEGVVALPDGRIAFVEVSGFAITVTDGTRTLRIATVHGAPNGMALGPDGALYVANNGGLGPDREHGMWVAPHPIDGLVQRVTTDGDVTPYADNLPGPTPHRPNDLCFGPDGGLWFTDSGNWEVFFTEQSDFRSSPPGYRGGALFRRDPDGTVARVADVGDFPNGLAFTPDGSELVVAQTVVRRLIAFPVGPEGGLGEPRLYAQLPDHILPDGLCFAEDGTLFAAGAIGDAIALVAPDGTVIDEYGTGKGSDPTNLCLTDGFLWITFGTGRMLARLDVEYRPLPLHGRPG